jgi:hypothetical protein
VYFFYFETAGRSLEDIDRYFTGNCPLLVFQDKEAIQEKRPEKYIEREYDEVRRNSSLVPGQAGAALENCEKEGDSHKESV